MDHQTVFENLHSLEKVQSTPSLLHRYIRACKTGRYVALNTAVQRGASSLMQACAVMCSNCQQSFLFEILLPSHISSKGLQNYRDICKGEQEIFTDPPAWLQFTAFTSLPDVWLLPSSPSCFYHYDRKRWGKRKRPAIMKQPSDGPANNMK